MADLGKEYLRKILRKHYDKYLLSWGNYITYLIRALRVRYYDSSPSNEETEYCLSPNSNIEKVRRFISHLCRKSLPHLCRVYSILFDLGAGECYDALEMFTITLEFSIQMNPTDVESHDAIVDRICGTSIPTFVTPHASTLRPPPWLGVGIRRSRQNVAVEEKPSTLTTPENYIPQEVEDIERACVVCQQNMKDHMISPCRHVCLCGVCAKELLNKSTKKEQCPVCRGELSKIEIVFF